MVNVSVIIPAYNEEVLLEETVSCLPGEIIDEIIVVNDGSTDNTAVRIPENVRKINFTSNRGKGEAVESGLKIARGDIIALVDADLGKSASEIRKLIEPVSSGEREITIAVPEIKGGGLGLVRMLAARGLRLITGQTMKAPLSGQRVFRRSILPAITPLSSGFGLEIGMDIDIIRNGIKYGELDCNINHRVTGHDWWGYFHRARQFYIIARTLWQKRSGLWKRKTGLQNMD